MNSHLKLLKTEENANIKLNMNMITCMHRIQHEENM